MLMATNIGLKLLTDARATVEARAVDEQVTSELDDAFSALPAAFDDLGSNGEHVKTMLLGF